MTCSKNLFNIPRQRAAAAGAALLALALLPACGENRPAAKAVPGAGQPPAELPFPPDPTAIVDLYAHSQAVVEEARRKLPDQARPIFDLGHVHRRFGFDDKALEVYQEGLGLDPRQPGIYETIGFILSQKNRLDKAVEAYRAALALDPRRAGMRERIGLILVHEGRLDDAVREYEGEISNETASANTQFLLGQAHLLRKDPASAAAAFREAVRLDDRHQNAYYGLFQAERDQKNESAAAAALARFKELKEADTRRVEEAPKKKTNREDQLNFTAETYIDVSGTYFSAGLEPEGLRALEAALLFNPRESGVRIQLAERLRQEGQAEEAIQHCRKVLEFEPRHPGALYMLAGLFGESKNFRGSAEMLGRLLEVQPGNADAHREYARVILSGMTFGPDSPARALEHAQRAADLKRTSQNLDVLSWALYSSGDRANAIETLRQALQADPTNPVLRSRLDRVLGQ